MIGVLACGFAASGAACWAAEPYEPKLPMKIPVLVILKETRQKTERITKELIAALQEGSRYHGYKDPAAQPSLAYQVVGTVEHLEPLPVVTGPSRLTDYRKIVQREGIRKWVEEQGVKEVWIFGYLRPTPKGTTTGPTSGTSRPTSRTGGPTGRARSSASTATDGRATA
jgi:hypothetical protein